MQTQLPLYYQFLMSACLYVAHECNYNMEYKLTFHYLISLLSMHVCTLHINATAALCYVLTLLLVRFNFSSLYVAYKPICNIGCKLTYHYFISFLSLHVSMLHTATQSAISSSTISLVPHILCMFVRCIQKRNCNISCELAYPYFLSSLYLHVCMRRTNTIAIQNAPTPTTSVLIYACS